MGNPCSSGVGAANPGSGAVAFLTNIAIQVFLGRIGLGWLATVAGAIPQLSFDVDDFCTDGQPDLPTIDAADVLALAAPLTSANWFTAEQKVKDLVLHYLWYDLCHCVSVATPAPPTTQTPPDVVGYGTAIDSAVCLVGQHTDNDWSTPISGSEKAVGLARWGSGAPVATGSSSAVQVRRATITATKTFGASGTHEDPWTLRVYWTGRSATPIIKTTDYSITGASAVVTEDAPLGALELRPAFVVHTGNAADSVTGDIDCFCDTLPGAPSQDCCPPDAGLLAAIADLASQLTLVKGQVDLIQRQAAPFGYITSTSHTGLTGTGHIDVADLIGCKIQLTSIPGYIGYEVGDVYEVFTDSWINWSVGAVSAPREMIRGYQQLSFPRNAGVFTRINYTLQPGLTIAIVELTKEP